MKKVTFKWFGKKYESALTKETRAAIERSAYLVHGTAARLLSQQGQTGPREAGLNKGKRGDKAVIKADRARIKGRALEYTNKEGETKRLERLYWNETEQKWVQASKPGDPPNKQSGDLRRSIGVAFGPMHLSAKIGPRDELVYARIQELGGRAGRGAYLPPRPYMVPALETNRETITKLLNMAVIKAAEIL